jgi:hypothetical protein
VTVSPDDEPPPDDAALPGAAADAVSPADPAGEAVVPHPARISAPVSVAPANADRSQRRLRRSSVMVMEFLLQK